MYGVHDAGMERTRLTVGVLAERSGVGVETIRFYEREGLLPAPARSSAGYRMYAQETVERVRFIRRAKELGFTLEEILELLALKVTHGKSCHSVRNRALAKLGDMDRKLKDLRQMRKALNAVVQRCSGEEGIDDCTILDALSTGPVRPKATATTAKRVLR